MTQALFTPEQVREFTKTLADSQYRELKIEAEIMQWLDQHPVSTQAVGLSTNDVHNLADFLKYRYDLNSGTEYIKDDLLTWLCESKMPPCDPVVVGLDPLQIHELSIELSKLVNGNYPNQEELRFTLSNWFDKQTFSQANKCSELEQPSWDSAPEWANWLAQNYDGSWRWFEFKPTWVSDIWAGGFSNKCEFVSKSENWQQTVQERPRGRVVVEVGQVWNSEPENEEFAVEIMCIGKRNCGEDAVCYKYKETQVLYVLPLSDFLAKFKQVQS